jgi:hypothetical protein
MGSLTGATATLFEEEMWTDEERELERFFYQSGLIGSRGEAVPARAMTNVIGATNGCAAGHAIPVNREPRRGRT